ncbi:MAG: response regulator [Spirochaetaceae bacterium]|nr:MAG: response regulator [Spirochaetaceae bacterium]
MGRNKRFTIAYFSNPIIPFLGAIFSFRTILDIFEKLDMNLLWCRHGRLSVPEGFEAEGNKIFQLIDKRSIDGVVISTPGFLSYLENEEDFYKLIHPFRDLPIVSSGALLNGLPSVVPDSYTDIAAVVDHLIKVHGRNKIVFLQGPADVKTAQDRLRAYKDTLKKNNIHVNPEYISRPLEWNSRDGRASGRRAVVSFLDDKKLQFDAIVASNDRLAVGAYSELESRGIRIPEDIAITGYDDYPEVKVLDAPLTSIPHPQNKIVRKAIHLVYDLLQGKDIPKKTKVHSHIHFRRSCGCYSSPLHRAVKIYTEHNEIENKSIKPKHDKESITGIILDECSVQNIAINSKLIEKIIDCLYENPETISTNAFLSNFKEIVKSSSADLEPEDWSIVLYIIQTVFQTYTSNINMKYVVPLLFDAQELLGEYINRAQYSELEEKELVSRRVNAFNQAIASAASVPQLLNIIFEQFSQMGLEEGYISFYHNKGDFSTSQLIFAFKNKKRINIDSPGLIFPTALLFPEKYKNRSERMNYFVAPLYYLEHHIGILVLKIDRNYGVCYPAISSQISHSFWAIKLMNEHERAKSELKRKAEELSRSNKELEELQKKKELFFINFTHEIKTPITLIASCLEQYMESANKNANLDIIRRNLSKLQRDMVNYLDYEKLLSSRKHFDHNQETDVSWLLHEKLILFQSLADKKQLKLKGQINDKVVIAADPGAVERIINNLLDNAFKYTEPGGQVEAKLTAIGQSVFLAVRDTGIGISSEDQKHLFEPFFQITRKNTRTNGIGMGLNIVRQIVEELKGKITVTSCLKGNLQGKLQAPWITEITVKLSLARQGAKKPKKTGNFFQLSHPVDISLEPAMFPTAKHNASLSTILVVEDNRDLLHVLLTNLGKKYNVYGAVNGKDALCKIELIPKPDLVISDIMMDTMDGYAFFNELKQLPEFIDVPVIFLTAISSPVEKLKSLSEGVIDIISKPLFSLGVLEAKIQSLLDFVSQKTKQVRGEALDKVIQAVFKERTRYLQGEERLNARMNAFGFSKREQHIIKLVYEGLQNKEISASLDISTRTIDNHLYNIYRKAGCQNRMELINKLLAEDKPNEEQQV